MKITISNAQSYIKFFLSLLAVAIFMFYLFAHAYAHAHFTLVVHEHPQAHPSPRRLLFTYTSEVFMMPLYMQTKHQNTYQNNLSLAKQ